LVDHLYRKGTQLSPPLSFPGDKGRLAAQLSFNSINRLKTEGHNGRESENIAIN
jgi:hypothetical protein